MPGSFTLGLGRALFVPLLQLPLKMRFAALIPALFLRSLDTSSTLPRHFLDTS